MENTITLDFMAEPCVALTAAVTYGERFGVKAEVTLMRGPSGWPTVEFTGGWTELDALLTDYYDGADREDSLR